jgi:cytochrome P450
MSDKQARDEVMTIFLAGHETTANALTWTFYLLSQNPTIDAKLLEELKSVIGDTGTVTVEDIPKLEYTEKVLRESMRLFPPVWSMSRHADSDFTLGDFTIPEGSPIVMSMLCTAIRFIIMSQTCSILIGGMLKCDHHFLDLAIFLLVAE